MLPDASLLVAFILASVLVIVSPGPDTLYVAARSLGQGRGAGLIAACGICTGLVGHGTAAALGLSSLFAYAPLAYDVVRYAGVAYLLYLAYRAFTAGDEDGAHLPTGSPSDRRGWWRIYRQAALTNLLNPKVAIFFIAFLPQFVRPGGGHHALQILVLAALFIAMGFGYLVVLVMTLGRLGDWLRARPKFWQLQRWVMGSMLGGIAIWLAVPERR